MPHPSLSFLPSVLMVLDPPFLLKFVVHSPQEEHEDYIFFSFSVNKQISLVNINDLPNLGRLPVQKHDITCKVKSQDQIVNTWINNLDTQKLDIY